MKHKLGEEITKIKEIEKQNDPKYKWNKCTFFTFINPYLSFIIKLKKRIG